MQGEPLVLRAALVAVVQTLLHLLVVQGMLDSDTEKAIIPVVEAFIGLAVVVLWTRPKVTPS